MQREHRDPFAVLGPHTGQGGREAGVMLRAFRPGAWAVTVVPQDERLAPRHMAPIHPTGLFEANVPERAEPFPYRRRCLDDAGREKEIEDPYRFPSALSDYDPPLMGEGAHHRNYEKFGAHLMVMDGVAGVCFAVWAPNARRVSVVGDFNGWDGRIHPMRARPANGIWEIFTPDLRDGSFYKFEVLPKYGPPVVKADPYAFGFELPPRTASVVSDLTHTVADEAWMAAHAAKHALDAPIAVYEVHLGSWRRKDGKTVPELPRAGARARWLR